MINAQKELLRAGGSILAIAGTIARLKSRLNEEASDKAKKGYEKAANIKKENNELTKKNIEQVTEKKAPQSFGELATTKEELPVESKVVEKKAPQWFDESALESALTKEELPVESKVVEKKAPQHFGELAGVEETFKQADAPTEKEVVEAKKPVQRFGELAGAEETPTTEQKYISSEESAYSPIKAENTETKIPVDEDVQGLIKVKQKNALRAAASRKSQLAYRASKGYEKDFPIRDYLPNVEDKELYKAGITKTELNKLSSILAGNGTDEDIQNWFKKHNASDTPIINMDSLTVSEDTAKEIKRLILDKDINLKEEQSKSSDWYDNFTRETNTYKVWEDQESSGESQETDRSFSGIIF